MKLVDASVELIEEKDPIKKIEKVARVCYKSEDKIGEGTAAKLVNALVKSKHYAMLEHSSAIFKADVIGYSKLQANLDILRTTHGCNTHIRTTFYASGRYIISGNLRAWLEYLQLCYCYNLKVAPTLLELLGAYTPIFDNICVLTSNTAGELTQISSEELTDEEKLVHTDVSIKFVCDRGVSHELVRHRIASFAQESTRYCNYSKNGDVTFIKPCYWKDSREKIEAFADICSAAERLYLVLLQDGVKPQEARAVLPTGLKTEIVMTANLNEWIHFLYLRSLGTTGAPHPQMQEVAVMAQNVLVDKYPFISSFLEGVK